MSLASLIITWLRSASFLAGPAGAFITNLNQQQTSVKKTLFLKPNPVGFLVLLVFLDRQEKMGKIIQKTQ